MGYKQWLLLAILPSNALLALYNGNPSAPLLPEKGMWSSERGWIRVQAGYQFDYQYDRKLHLVGQGIAHLKKKVEKSDFKTQLGVLAFNFASRVELFSTLGTLSSTTKQQPLEHTKITYTSDPYFAWGVGGRALLAYWGDIQLGIDASYLSCTPPLSSIRINGKKIPKKNAQMDFSEWQIGMAVSYQLHWFVPYIGVDYSDFRARMHHLKSLKFLFPSDHATFKDSIPLGVYFGFGIAFEKALALNVEARFCNENAVSASADFRF